MEAIIVKFFDVLFAGPVAELTSSVLGISKTIAGTLIIVYMGYKICLYLADLDSKFDPSILARPILTLGALVLYDELVSVLIHSPTTLINDTITGGGVGSPSAGPFLDTMKFRPDGLDDFLSIAPILELVHLGIFLVASTVAGYMMFRSVILMAAFHVLGGLALAFSLIPGNMKTVETWFFGYVGVALWVPIINILRALIAKVNLADETFDNPIIPVAIQIAFIFSLLQIPKFASLIISQGYEGPGSGGGTGLGDQVKSGAKALYKGAKKL